MSAMVMSSLSELGVRMRPLALSRLGLAEEPLVRFEYDAERALGGRDRDEEEEVDEEEWEDDRAGSVGAALACLTRISRTSSSSSSSSSSDVEDETGEALCGGGEDRGCEGAVLGYG